MQSIVVQAIYRRVQFRLARGSECCPYCHDGSAETCGQARMAARQHVRRMLSAEACVALGLRGARPRRMVHDLGARTQ